MPRGIQKRKMGKTKFEDDLPLEDEETLEEDEDQFLEELDLED